MTDTATEPGPAATLRRLAVDAATRMLGATTVRDEAGYRGEVRAYLQALAVLTDSGLADEGIAPYHGTHRESSVGLDELIRLAGENARLLGLTRPEGS